MLLGAKACAQPFRRSTTSRILSWSVAFRSWHHFCTKMMPWWKTCNRDLEVICSIAILLRVFHKAQAIPTNRSILNLMGMLHFLWIQRPRQSSQEIEKSDRPKAPLMPHQRKQAREQPKKMWLESSVFPHRQQRELPFQPLCLRERAVGSLLLSICHKNTLILSGTFTFHIESKLLILTPRSVRQEYRDLVE